MVLTEVYRLRHGAGMTSSFKKALNKEIRKTMRSVVSEICSACPAQTGLSPVLWTSYKFQQNEQLVFLSIYFQP